MGIEVSLLSSLLAFENLAACKSLIIMAGGKLSEDSQSLVCKDSFNVFKNANIKLRKKPED